METFIVLCEFFGGIILFWGIAWWIGHFLKLDKYYKEYNQHEMERINKIYNSDEDNDSNK